LHYSSARTLLVVLVGWQLIRRRGNLFKRAPASRLLFVQDNPRRCRDACLSTCRQLRSLFARIYSASYPWQVPDKRGYRTSGFTFRVCRPTRVEWRNEVWRWERKHPRARIWSGHVRGSRLMLRRAHTRRPYDAPRAISGSVMPMLRMSSGIRACWQRLSPDQRANRNSRKRF
jgi:hypothetical protein